MRRERPAPPLPEPLHSLVDAHTHLDACGATDAASTAEILDRAESVGVGRVVTVADDLAAARFAVDAAQWDPRVWAAVAIHPTRANVLDDAVKAEIERLASDPRVVAVGETGLDYYWPGKLDGCATIDEQHDGFRWHIDLAKRLGKPLMIHNREADEDLLSVLKHEGAPETVIFHCFSSGPEIARACIDAGYVLSLSGTVSFKNAHALREAAVLIPDDQLLVETDAPFLTPHPFRGAPNESYCLPYTARALAEIRGQDPVELASHVTENAERVYALRARE
ncbi:TatD family hydrolase [Rhodococcus sp. BP-252]|uniref:TatD family hydrolase n=1 Tax=unclassified Rhodococcus (in: high G+C Gram-positive bacteria) TaxID=192944 RepID=UPI001C9BBC74|nr:MULTISPECIES: TatD family hydrolase [unclassified Rhodococcus (in: high G+C Gram-positive bacteria)]MBY6414610.1 TatD family hydrolase [Rhodococcus sp. BP-320]MBY6419367.1 TatD family hydrolase [Rhodococcus sp. BP-321]MBY6424349.1 TatD family hydrolase [Rhodococcus sp. BP-324]MBY6429446.1 TatD family hydrolase [Rhodococcus sp. BP-323]MBY6431965.1 TatD family hydrolase [Rhodococcus sp. BP-322]